MPCCIVCEKPQASINALHLHLKIFHKTYDEIFKCKEKNCFRTIKGWRQFRRHLINSHKCPIATSLLNNKSKQVVSKNVHDDSKGTSIEFDKNNIEIEFDKNDIENDHNQFNLATPDDIENHVQSLALTFIGKLYANPRTPRSQVQEIVESVSELLENIVAIIKPLLKSTQSIKDSMFCFNDILSAVVKPFRNNLSTEYRRLKIIEKSGNFIKARDYVVGDRLENILQEGRIIQDRISIKAKFVPIREVLQQFFSLEGVLNETLSYMHYLDLEKEKGIISNFVQGELWSEKKKNSLLKIVLPIFLYYDDFEVNNPLGSHAGVHKIGAVYFSIPCLPPQFRAMIKNIFVAALFHSKDRKNSDEGNDAIFYILVEELNFLAREGINLVIDGKITTVFFFLGLFTGDNEGLNSALGFIEGPNANHYCRFCKMNKYDSQKNCSLRKQDIRTPQQYEVDGFQSQSETDIKENSIWNLVTFFHVVRNYFVDIMHDLLEGVCRYDMRHILFYLICEKKVLCIDRLNAKLKSFNYVQNGFKNSPPLLTICGIQNKHILMSASEMHTFVLIFPFLVSHIIEGSIDLTDEIWQFFFLLREIMDICFAKSTQANTLDVLESLIFQHHTLYCKLLNDTLKPKHHNMIHYSKIIKMSGPLSHLSVMRFESKHRELKAIATGTTSRLNICHTIALKEQLRLCHRLSSKIGFSRKYEYGSGEIFECLSQCDRYFKFQDSIPRTFVNSCLSVQWVNIYGIIYRIGTFIMLDVNPEGFPHFGKIIKIFLNEDQQVCFVCESMIVDSFIEYMHAYQVTASENFTCYLYENLCSPFLVIYYCSADGTEFITLRYVAYSIHAI